MKAAVNFISFSPTAQDICEAVFRTLTPETFDEKELRWGFNRFSPREMEVAERLAAGMTCHDIAIEFGISKRMVGVYRTRIIVKTRVKDVSELLRMMKAWNHLQ